MDILTLLIWIVLLLVIHVLLLKIIEMKILTEQLMRQLTLKTVPVKKVRFKEPCPKKEIEISMEEELMNYVYNYQEPELNLNPPTEFVNESIQNFEGISKLQSRLVPTDATNIVAAYPQETQAELSSYCDTHDEFKL